ncbi:MAG: UDP-N-acetylmuramoyl-tripeptide--D-alanyl-D-alanine ligase [Spirochaetes bacterium]|nr:UDP-N-acetylmuramoyl-tripeptide--D-alanyl-D-alanine ligase [Spirochaetota bacterium]
MQPDDHTLMTVKEAASMMSGTLLLESAAAGKNILSVVIDSRKVKAGALFFALKGENADGHSFIKKAVSAGAVCCVAEKGHSAVIGFTRGADDPGFSVITVDDTLKALQALAKNYRSKFKNISIIGITGSNGKTTTKELLAAIFEQDAPTVMNEGNLNSETGLPLALFGIREIHKYGVFEMGINHPGEMAVLADVAMPDYAILTNIGTAHIGNMGSRERIAEEKMKIFGAPEKLKKGIVHEKDDFAKMMKDKYGDKMDYFGLDSQSDYLSYEDSGLAGNIVFLGKEKIAFSLIGRHNLLNAAAAIKMAKIFNVSDSKIKEGIEKVTSFFGRGEIFSGNITVVFDAYNSSKEAVKTMVDFADKLSWNGRKIILLGSVFETGDKSEEIHGFITNYTIKNFCGAVFFFGKEFEAGFRNMEKSEKFVFWSADFEEMKNALLTYLKEGDLIVLKGSRGMALERFLEVIRRRSEGCGQPR